MSNDAPKAEHSGPRPHAVDRSRRVVEHAAAELEMRLAQTLAPGLYLVATPIGNLGDITLRALAVLTNAGAIYCEDTRQSLKLMQRFGIQQRLETYHEHNAERERPRILRLLAAGNAVALISDAGTPLVSDPGYKLVRDAIEAGHQVQCIPGASAVLAGLIASGLPTDSFHFAGFLPAKSGARRGRVAELARLPGTLILFEGASRLAATMGDLAAGLGARPGAIARELTKINEVFQHGSLDELAQWAAGQDQIKGEIVILVGAAGEAQADDDAILQALEPALAVGSVRDAVGAVATRLGVARSRVYDLAIAWRKDNPT